MRLCDQGEYYCFTCFETVKGMLFTVYTAQFASGGKMVFVLCSHYNIKNLLVSNYLHRIKFALFNDCQQSQGKGSQKATLG